MKKLLTISVFAGFFGAVGPVAMQAETQPLVASPAAKMLATLPSVRAEQRFTAWLTGYSYWDNTPPGSSSISKPMIHRRAGGKGTYQDPITIAVGHRIDGGRQTLDFKPGTKFYLTRLHKYAIVEDVCGDGNAPQNGPCHTGKQGRVWLDIYIGGARSNASSATQCAGRLTAFQDVIINPRPDYPVHEGEILESGCKVF